MPERKIEIPICDKLNLSVEEAAAYSGIGIQKIREMMRSPDCDFVLQVGCKKNLIKRVKFEKYIMAREYI
ncbi:MAG: transposase [Clostridiales bacterium]|nr:transposase [Clostridiales bacterium]